MRELSCPEEGSRAAQTPDCVTLAIKRQYEILDLAKGVHNMLRNRSNSSKVETDVIQVFLVIRTAAISKVYITRVYMCGDESMTSRCGR